MRDLLTMLLSARGSQEGVWLQDSASCLVCQEGVRRGLWRAISADGISWVAIAGTSPL